MPERQASFSLSVPHIHPKAAALFSSTNQELTKDYLEFWASATANFMDFYEAAKLDGSEDAVRCRVIAAARLSQLGLSMFQFFSTGCNVLKSGMADQLAMEATGRVVADVVTRKLDQWVSEAVSGQN